MIELTGCFEKINAILVHMRKVGVFKMIKDPKFKEFEIQKVSKVSLLLQNLQN